MAVNLMDILPEYFRPVLEFEQIMKAHGVAVDILEKNIGLVKANCFVQTADAATIKTYEELFGLTYKLGDTLEYRRQRILQQFNIIPPFSIGFLRSRLTGLFGADYTLRVDPVASTLFVLVTSSRYGAVDLLYSLIWDVVPVHMEVTANHQVTNDVGGGIYMGGVVSNICIQTI